MDEHEQYPMLRDLAEGDGEITVPAIIVRELFAERDRLQAAEDDRNEIRTLIEASSLGTPEAKAIRARTPPEVAKAIVLASEYYGRAERAEAERDALRRELDDERTQVAVEVGEGERIEALLERLQDAEGELREQLRDVVAERDRLRAEHENLWSVMERVGQELDRVLHGDDLGPDARAALETVSLNVNLVLGVGADEPLDASGEATDG